MEFRTIIFTFLLYGLPFAASFSWKSCGKTTQMIKILSLDIYTNNNTMFITSKGKLGINITSPIEANIKMQKKVFWGWIQLPCVDQMGSCTHQDVCALSPYQNKSCPEDFIKNQLPCKCPILQGQYAAKKFPVDLSFLPNFIESGTYKINFTLNKNNEEILCLIINITI